MALFPNKATFAILGLRTSTCEFWLGHNLTHNNILNFLSSFTCIIEKQVLKSPTLNVDLSIFIFSWFY